MDDVYFQVYDDYGNLLAEIQVFDDMSFWINTDGEHKVVTDINGGFGDEPDEGTDIVDEMLDYLDKHNRNTEI